MPRSSAVAALLIKLQRVASRAPPAAPYRAVRVRVAAVAAIRCEDIVHRRPSSASTSRSRVRPPASRCPAIAVPSANCTDSRPESLPSPVTVAVNVTACPASEGYKLLAISMLALATPERNRRLRRRARQEHETVRRSECRRQTGATPPAESLRSSPSPRRSTSPCCQLSPSRCRTTLPSPPGVPTPVLVCRHRGREAALIRAPARCHRQSSRRRGGAQRDCTLRRCARQTANCSRE